MKKNVICRTCLSVILAVSLLVSTVLMTGCTVENKSSEDGVLTIVATTYAGYDFARQITKTVTDGTVDIILLGKTGQDMHSYEPTAADILTLGRADLLISLGGTSEAWLDATLTSAMNENVRRVAMTEVCETMADAPTEGMDIDHHDHTGHDHTANEGCGLIGSDEHVWLSPTNAILVTRALGDALCAVDPDRANTWTAGTTDYITALTTLKNDFAAMREGAVRDAVLIADRYPFTYLMRELDLTAYAAFPGCSSETSASFETQTFLIEKAKELSLSYIFIIDGSDGKVASVVATESGAGVLTLDSIQVVTDRSKTYIELMRKNLENLKKALY